MELKFRQPLFLKGKFNGWHYWGFIKHKTLSDYIFTSPVGNNKTQEEIMKLSQQFTGLKDKTGKEIFEGDILKLKHDRRRWISKGNVLVIWENCEFCAERLDESVTEEFESLGNYRFDDYDIEIIGNKFENPELLEVQNR